MKVKRYFKRYLQFQLSVFLYKKKDINLAVAYRLLVNSRWKTFQLSKHFWNAK